MEDDDDDDDGVSAGSMHSRLPMTGQIRAHINCTRRRAGEKAESAHSAIYAIFQLIACILAFCYTKYHILTFRNKYRILTFRSLWLTVRPTLVLSGSGPLWLSLARFPALSGSLSGSLWLPLALSGSLWLSLAMQICLQSPCLARKALAQLVAALLCYMTFYRSDQTYIADTLTLQTTRRSSPTVHWKRCTEH